MIKRGFLWLIFLAMSVSAFSIDLQGTTWGPEKRGFGYYLKFTTENKFEFLYSGEGGGQNVQGNYTKNGNEVVLTTTIINEWGELPAYIKRSTIKCSLEETESLFSSYKLVGNGGLELWSMDHKPKDGERGIVDGVMVYTHDSEGKLNISARVREGPGLQYRYIGFLFDDDSTKYFSLPRGFPITILGISENKTVIDGVEKGWYYCTFKTNMWEIAYGWIWSGLVDLLEDNSQHNPLER